MLARQRQRQRFRGIDDRYILANLAYGVDFRADTLPAGLTFSRASAATDVINGVLTSFASGAPRISAANGYFGENEQRTNYVFPSVGNILSWTGAGAETVIPDYGIAPDGNNKTLAIKVDAVTRYAFKDVWSAADNSVWTCSFFIKKVAGTVALKLWFLGGTTPIDANYTLDLATGGLTKNSGFDALNLAVVSCGDFWRVGICLQNNATGNTGVRLSFHPQAQNFVYEIWGLQYEHGEGMTSYIPTTTAASTRAADVLYATPAINATEGMVIVEYIEDIAFSASRWTRAARINDGTNNNLIYVYNSPVNTEMILYGMSGGVKNCEDAFGNTGVNVITKWGMAYSPSGLSACLNGGAVYLKPVTPPVGLNRIEIGPGGFCGYIRRIKLYNARNDAKMRALTA